MLGSLVISALLITRIKSSPVAYQSSEALNSTLSARADDSKYKTKIFMRQEKVSFGNKKVDAVIRAAMGPACGHGSADCQDPWDSLTQQTTCYVDDSTSPVSGTLTFNNDAEFDIGMSDHYVEALARAGAAAAKHHTQTKSWAVPDSSISCLHYGLCDADKGKDTFYAAPSYIKVARYEVDAGENDDPVDWMEYTVTLERHDDEDGGWCEFLDIAETLSGAVSGVASAFFGVVGLATC